MATSMWVLALGLVISITIVGFAVATFLQVYVQVREAGIGRKRADLLFDEAAEELLTWAKAEKRSKTGTSCGENITQLKRSFAGRRLSEIFAFTVASGSTARFVGPWRRSGGDSRPAGGSPIPSARRQTAAHPSAASSPARACARS